jgi:hypothetical protein
MTHPLADEFRKKATRLRADGAPQVAEVWELAAAELDRWMEAHDSEPLSLTAASRESGYSSSQLSRLVSEGRIPNAGRPGAPMIARRDLPKKLALTRRPPVHRTDHLPSVAEQVLAAQGMAVPEGST